MTNFPTSLDDSTSLPYPSATDDTNSPSLSGGQDNQNDALIAVETKLGTGSSTPSGTYALVSTGTGTSSWSLATPASTIVGISDTQTLTNKTIDAANNTITNLSGSNLANNTITATQIANATITGTQLASNLSLSGTLTTGGFVIGNLPVWQYLGSATSTVDTTNATTTAVQITGLSITATVPTGYTKVKISVILPQAYNSAAESTQLTIWRGTVSTGTQVGAPTQITTAFGTELLNFVLDTPTAGSVTYNAGIAEVGGGTSHTNCGAANGLMIVEVC